MFRFRLFCRLESVLSMPSFTFHLETFTASFLVCLPLYGADLREPDYGGVAPLRFIRSLHLTLSTVALISRVRRLSIKKDCSLANDIVTVGNYSMYLNSFADCTWNSTNPTYLIVVITQCLQIKNTTIYSPGATGALYNIRAPCVTSSPFYQDWLTLIPARISNYLPSNVWDEITYQFLIFNGCTVEV